MAMRDDYGDEDGIRLLAQLEVILDQDPLIDEVGFVHPSQLETFHFLEGHDTTESLAEDVQTSTAGERNLVISSEGSPFESVGGKLNLLLVDRENTESNRGPSYDRSVFWCRDHKLAICIPALFPLYKAAKSAYLFAYRQYKILGDLSQNEDCSSYVCGSESSSESLRECRSTLDLQSVEAALLKHSKVVVILSCDYASAWNSRKQIISQKEINEVYWAELQLSALVLSYAPKSEQAWSYRRWLIKLIVNVSAKPKEPLMDLERESDFLEHIAEKSQMNYRAWRHRCWLVNHMSTRQVLTELLRTKRWAQLHVGDNCCFHYRRCLLLHLCESKSSSSREKKVFSTEDFYGSFQNDTQEDWDEPFMIWKDELDWNKYLIKYYIGREALWIHRRFLFHELIQQPRFHYSETSSTIDSDISPKKEAPRDGYSHQQLHTFLGEEFELIDTCLNVPDTGFEDTTQQKEYAAMYKMWMIMQLQWINGSKELLERIEKERCNLKAMIEKVCPQRAVVWEGLFCLNQCSYVEPH